MQSDRLMEKRARNTDRAEDLPGNPAESRKPAGGAFAPRTSRHFAESDEELYRLMRKGNQRAFAALYERREPALYRYALHMTGSRTAAEEVAQEVFVRLLGPHLHFDDRRGSLEGYMYGVARNLVRVLRRKGSVEEVVEQSTEHDILGDLIKDQATTALYRALDDLPEHYRDAVVLCDLEERSYEDASRLMECPVGTVRSRLHRARALLASRLKPEQATAEARAR
jgi:RNA polymerase sigma-70 factor (ECF subfamily)